VNINPSSGTRTTWSPWVSPAGRAHRHHPAAEVELVGVVVDDVRLAELDTAQLRGHGVPEAGEHLDVAGALPGPVLAGGRASCSRTFSTS